MLHKPGVTESLARFVVATRWKDIPPSVRHQAKRSLLNFFAVALAGRELLRAAFSSSRSGSSKGADSCLRN